MDELTSQLAENLKAIRKKGNYSLDDLALLCGVSKSALAQIERGETSPSISTVWKIANGLKTSFTELLRRPQESAVVVGFREREHLSASGDGYRIYPLFPFEEDRGFEVYYVEMDEGVSMEAEGHGTGVEEYVFVLSGRLGLHFSGERIVVEAERSIRFAAERPHGYSNPGKGPLRAIMMLYYGKS
jgi:XRE family transcriptional regulator, regulator of sulfur utilization